MAATTCCCAGRRTGWSRCRGATPSLRSPIHFVPARGPPTLSRARHRRRRPPGHRNEDREHDTRAPAHRAAARRAPRATDGFGVRAIFTYRPLTDAAVHAAGSGAELARAGRADQRHRRRAAQDDRRHRRGLPVVHGISLRGIAPRRAGPGIARIPQDGQHGTLGARGRLRSKPCDGRTFRIAGLPEPGRHAPVLRQDSLEHGVPLVEARVGKQVSRAPLPVSVEGHDAAITRREERSMAPRSLRSVRAVAAIDATSGFVTDETITTTEIGGRRRMPVPQPLSACCTPEYSMTPRTGVSVGRRRVEITAGHTLAGGMPVVRTADQDWDGPKCRPTRIRLLPGDSQWQVDQRLCVRRVRQRRRREGHRRRHGRSHGRDRVGRRGQLPMRVTDPLVAVNALRLGRGQRTASRVHGSQ